VKANGKSESTAKSAVVSGESCILLLTATHEVVCADLSLNNVTDSEAFLALSGRLTEKSGQPRQTGLTIPGSVTMNCAAKISALIPPRKGAGYWPGEYADRNRAVANQRLSGSNARWKWTTEYNRRSIAETAMYRMKQLLRFTDAA
jgi:hypothetical protein